MGFWSNLFGTAVPPPPVAPTGFQAKPLVVTTPAANKVGSDRPAPGQAGLDHAKYRLDAIHRTIQQSGAQLSDVHLEEFRAETRQHVHTLIAAGLLTDDEGLKIVRFNKGMPK